MEKVFLVLIGIPSFWPKRTKGDDNELDRNLGDTFLLVYDDCSTNQVNGCQATHTQEAQKYGGDPSRMMYSYF